MAGDLGVGFVDVLPRTDKFVTSLTGQLNKAFGSVSGSAAGASKLVSGLQYGFIALGAAATVAISKAVNATVAWAREVLTLQRTTGQTAESASALLAVMGEFGLSAQQATVGLGIFDKNIVNNSANLLKYGIATHDASGELLPFDEVLGNAADKFVSLGNAQKQTAFAMNVFGRSGKQLIPILRQGADGIEELKQEAQATGLVIGQDTVDAAVALGRQQRELNESWKGLAVTVGTEFLPVMTDLTRVFTEFVQFLTKVPTPVYGVVLGFTALAGVGALLIKIGTGIVGAWSSLFGVLASAGAAETVVIDPTIALAGAISDLTIALGGVSGSTIVADEALVGYGVTESGLLVPTEALSTAQKDLAASTAAANEAAAGGASFGFFGRILRGITALAGSAAVKLAGVGAAAYLLGSIDTTPHLDDQEKFNQALGDYATSLQGLKQAKAGEASTYGPSEEQWKAMADGAREQAIALGGVGAAVDYAAKHSVSYDEALQHLNATSKSTGSALKIAFSGINDPNQLLGEATNGVELLGTQLAETQGKLRDFGRYAGADVNSVLGAIAKVATDPTKKISDTVDAYEQGIATLQQANQQWHDSIVSAFGGAGSALDQFADKSKVDIGKATSSLHNYTADIKTFGGNIATIQDKFGKNAKDFINWASTQGLAQSGLVQAVAKSNGKMGESFINNFNKANAATDSLASQIQKALDPVFNHIIAELQNVVRVIQGLPPLKIKADASEAKAEVQNFLGGIPKDVYIRIHQQQITKTYATGGFVPAFASGGSTDTIPAMLSPGEFVMRRSAVERIGAGTLARLNAGGPPSGAGGGGVGKTEVTGDLRITDWRRGIASLAAEQSWEDTVQNS